MKIAYMGKGIKTCSACAEHVEREFPIKRWLPISEAVYRWPRGALCWYCGAELLPPSPLWCLTHNGWRNSLAADICDEDDGGGDCYFDTTAVGDPEWEAMGLWAEEDDSWVSAAVRAAVRRAAGRASSHALPVYPDD